MGVVSTIGFTSFPSQKEDRLNLVVDVPIKLPKADLAPNFTNLKGKVVRSDAGFPFREIIELDADQFDDNVPHYYDSRIRESYPEEYGFLHNATESYCLEGKEVEVIFNYDTKKITRGLCIFDRGPSTLFKLLDGRNEGKIVASGECQYSPI